MMRKFIDDAVDEVEVASYDLLIELFKTHNETEQKKLELVGSIANALIESFRESNNAHYEFENKKHELEKQKFELRKEELNYGYKNRQSTRECITTENPAGLSEKTLVAKSSTATKPKAKSRSPKG